MQKKLRFIEEIKPKKGVIDSVVINLYLEILHLEASLNSCGGNLLKFFKYRLSINDNFSLNLENILGDSDDEEDKIIRSYLIKLMQKTNPH